MSAVEPTELVAGAWQLRPWPSAYADLDEVLAERYADADERATQRTRRLEGWATGDYLAFAVREITTGRSVAECAVLLDPGSSARFETWLRPTHAPNAHEHAPSTAPAQQAEAAVRRWAAATLPAPPDRSHADVRASS